MQSLRNFSNFPDARLAPVVSRWLCLDMGIGRLIFRDGRLSLGDVLDSFEDELVLARPLRLVHQLVSQRNKLFGGKIEPAPNGPEAARDGFGQA